MLVAASVLLGTALALPGTPIATIEHIESFALPNAARLEVDALSRRVRLQGVKVAPVSVLCAEVRATKPWMELRCRTGRMEVRLDTVQGRRVLTIAELRGLPAFDGEATLPLFFYDPVDLGLGGPCPGDTPASRGECALQRGDWATATAELAVAIEGRHAAYAAVRLGDAAFLLGEPARAADFWDRAGPAGPFARLAAARLCEVLGACAEHHAVGLTFAPFDAGGLAPALGDEIRLRHARSLAYDGDLVASLAVLHDGGGSACGRAPVFCRRLALERLRLAGDEVAVDALALLAVMPDRVAGPHAAELTDRIAAHAARAGAPRFAAALVSATTVGATTAAMEGPLLRAAELYLEGDDWARAAAIERFARVRLPARKERERWLALANALEHGRAP